MARRNATLLVLLRSPHSLHTSARVLAPRAAFCPRALAPRVAALGARVALAGCALAAASCSEVSPPAPVPPAAEPAPSPSAARGAAAPASTANAAASASASTAPPVAAAASAAAASAAAAGTRIWGKSRFTWIHPRPFVSNAWIGYIGLGGSAPLKGGSLESAKVADGGGCKAWYQVEPAGFVCAGEIASIDPTDPLTAALVRDTGKADSAYPFSYAESLGAPRYTRIPTVDEMRTTEWDLELHLGKIAKIRAAKTPEEAAKIDKELIGVDFAPSGNPPPDLADVNFFIREGRKHVFKGSTVAWIRAFDVAYPDGKYGITSRTFLLTSDHAIVPKDRVRPFPESRFAGVRLGGDIQLPIAFFRKTARPKYKREADGSMVATGETWAARSFTMVTGEEVKSPSGRFVATREQGIYAKADDATVLSLATPPVGGILDTSGRGTWLDISVMGGWLVAYEKTTPVFATLISPGRGGIPFPGMDPLATASTPIGNFRIDGKFVWASMVSSTNSDLIHSEVQYVQNFHGPHALHGAYWHDAFGEPKSGGCINLSPIDARFLFEFTEPSLPAGWHGLRSTDKAGYATVVSVHR